MAICSNLYFYYFLIISIERYHTDESNRKKKSTNFVVYDTVTRYGPRNQGVKKYASPFTRNLTTTVYLIWIPAGIIYAVKRMQREEMRALVKFLRQRATRRFVYLSRNNISHASATDEIR